MATVTAFALGLTRRKQHGKFLFKDRQHCPNPLFQGVEGISFSILEFRSLNRRTVAWKCHKLHFD